MSTNESLGYTEEFFLDYFASLDGSIDGIPSIPSEEMLALEQKAHRIFTHWAQAHADDDPSIGILPYNRSAYPEQAITVPKTRSRAATIPRPLLPFYKLGMGAAFGRTIGWSESREFVNVLQTSPAYAGKRIGVANAVALDYIAAGESVLGLEVHSDRHVAGLAYEAAGMGLAMPGTTHMPLIDVVLNYNMTRETFKGKGKPRSIARSMGRVANGRWVMPKTESINKYVEIANQDGGEEITQKDVDDILTAVNLIGGLSVARDTRRAGHFTVLNPNGQRPEHTTENSELGGKPVEKLVKIDIPPVYQESANLLNYYAAILPTAVFGGRISVGHLIDIEPFTKTLSREDKKDPEKSQALVQEREAHYLRILEEGMESTAEQVRQLVGDEVEVEYHEMPVAA